MNGFIRLMFTVEGDTEERFVKEIIIPHLSHYGVYPYVRKVLTKKDKRSHREYRGGYAPYQRVKDDILSWMKEDNHSDCRFTTMFDLYALGDDFPKYDVANTISDPYQKVIFLEEALKADINDYRFVPYIQLHEFETLIFADANKIHTEYFEHDQQIKNLVGLLNDFNNNPELIDSGYTTAPSKRILSEIPEYDKYGAGPNILKEIGLSAIREKCRHFNDWITTLEGLSES